MPCTSNFLNELDRIFFMIYHKMIFSCEFFCSTPFDACATVMRTLASIYFTYSLFSALFFSLHASLHNTHNMVSKRIGGFWFNTLRRSLLLHCNFSSSVLGVVIGYYFHTITSNTKKTAINLFICCEFIKIGAVCINVHTPSSRCNFNVGTMLNDE